MTIEVNAPAETGLFDDTALKLLHRLHDELDDERRRLLDARQEVRRSLNEGGTLDFREETRHIREDPDWRIAPTPPALQDRRVEITGPTTAKMVINALNSGARCFMADFEDSNSPTWRNMTQGQLNLQRAIRGTLEHEEKGKEYRLSEDPAVLLARVRGLHLPERHLEPEVAGAFMDFALYVRHNAEALLERGWGADFFVPHLQSPPDARA